MCPIVKGMRFDKIKYTLFKGVNSRFSKVPDELLDMTKCRLIWDDKTDR